MKELLHNKIFLFSLMALAIGYYGIKIYKIIFCLTHSIYCKSSEKFIAWWNLVSAVVILIVACDYFISSTLSDWKILIALLLVAIDRSNNLWGHDSSLINSKYREARLQKKQPKL